jgi:hypothetical protein
VTLEQRIAALLLVAVIACSGSQSGAGGGRGGSVVSRSIDQVLAAHTDSLMALPGVVGTAIGLCEGERCIKVLLADSTKVTKSRIPARLEGYRVVTEVTGTFRPR